MPEFRRILVLQTAFLGDVILTLPLVQVLKRTFADAEIDFMAIPRAAEVLRNHPDIAAINTYDKRGSQSGLGGLLKKSAEIRFRKYDAALIPHRSIRSALIARLANIPLRVGFDSSAGRMFLTHTVHYRKECHEYRRNLDLLEGLGMQWEGTEFPRLYPSTEEKERVKNIVSEWCRGKSTVVAVAPGTVWNTKRWPQERFAAVSKMLIDNGYYVALIGGPEDTRLCEEIASTESSGRMRSFAGKFSILGSAEFIRNCALLIANDSAPVHIAVSVGTPVEALFGATVPSFGFAPYGERDKVIETNGLSCRPCSLHGGERCPIGTFECMKNISAVQVFEDALRILR